MKQALIVCTFLVCASLAAAQTKAPLPEKVTSAKNVFLLNQSDVKLGDAVYRELKKWNRWQVVTDKTKADLLIVVSQQETYAGAVSTGSANSAGSTATGTAISIPVSEKSWFLHVADAHSGELLWTVKARLAFWGKTWNGMAKQMVGDLRDRM